MRNSRFFNPIPINLIRIRRVLAESQGRDSLYSPDFPEPRPNWHASPMIAQSNDAKSARIMPDGTEIVVFHGRIKPGLRLFEHQKSPEKT
ncbi:hypothetical protein A8B82_19075 [Sulfitobacter sp. EhC04]|nr:hypothetical protein A8B82_19075 [Sulfitobacter sp. EhC04]